MAIFRKNKKTSETAAERRYRLEAESNQSKWDELERLVSDSDPNSVTASASIPELGTHDLLNSDSGGFTSDLTVDLPSDSEFEDVTPSEASTLDAMVPSEHFDTDASTDRSESLDAFIPAPPAVSRPDRADIGAMRLDVARISADIQSGEELYRRAQQRIENLTSFVERAEIDFSMLNRLEPENRRLKARNRTIEREIDANAQKMEVLRADLEDREQRLNEKSRVYETTLGKLAIAQKSLQEYELSLIHI